MPAHELTAPQLWALRCIANGHGRSPGNLGYAMTQRPGYAGKDPRYLKAQGAGRMGGTMMERLREKGLVEVSSCSPYSRHWCPTWAKLTPAGRALLETQDE